MDKPEERTAFKVDQNFHQESVFLEQVLLRSAIETSEFLVLTQDTGYNPNTPGVCFVAETANYTVRGDVVRICGPISCPGRSIKIVCRVLQLYPDSQMEDAAIIVDGKDGKDGELVVALPKDGVDGVGFRAIPGHTNVWGTADSGYDGSGGEPGSPGNNGAPGDNGGTIEIHCQTLSLTCATKLSANGGKGGSASGGTRGGHGGRGSAGKEVTTASWGRGGAGAPGSAGGPGGAGNNGGRGGRIILHCESAVDPQLTLSARGGDGGDGGKGGDGGRGGDGGTVGRHGKSFGQAGQGGPRGPGGKSGYGGKGGVIRIADAESSSTGPVLKFSHGSQGADAADSSVWGSLGIRVKSDHPRAAVTSWGPNRLDIFVVAYQEMDHKTFDDGRSSEWESLGGGWESLGGKFQSPPAAVSWGPGRIDVVGIGLDQALYHKAFSNNSWAASWERLGGKFTGAPAVASWGPGRLDIFVVGADQAMHHKSWEGNWVPLSLTEWESLGGKFQSPPAAVCWGPGRIDVVGIGLDQALYHKAFSNNSWAASWERLGGKFTGAPAVASWGPGRLDIFGIGADQAMHHKSWEGNWVPLSLTEWESLGGKFQSPPAAVCRGPGRLDIFGIGVHRDMFHKSWGGAWAPEWEGLGGTFTGVPAVASWGPGRLDIFGIDHEDESVRHTAGSSPAWVVSYGRQGADAADGADGADGTWDQTPLPAHGRPVPLPGHVPSGPPAQRLALGATATADSATYGSLEVGEFSNDAVRQQVSLSQLRMLMERLRFLFLRLGRADLTIDPEQQKPDLMELLAGIQWIQDLLGEEKSSFTATDRSIVATLLQSANSLYDNIRFENDYFGNTSTFAPIGTVQFFDRAKKQALTDLESAEAEYHSYRTAMNDSATSQAGLQLAVRVTGARVEQIKAEAKDTLDDAKAALAEINRLRDLLDAKGKALAQDAGDLKAEVQKTWGMSWQDLFGALTQLSFMHWGNLPQKVESGPVLMATSQVGDLFNKGISNVVTDSGQSLSKDYVVKQVDTLASGIKSFKDLTVTRSKLIDTSNLYNDSYKLMMTRDQFKTLCSDFTANFDAAEKIIDDLDDYVTLADQRNAAVMEYNQLWQHVYDLQAEAVRAEADYEHAQSGIAGEVQPSLPIFTSFATERYNRAKNQTLHIYYLASRAYILKSLKIRNLFSKMLNQLPATGQIDAATIRQAHLDSLYDQVMTELKRSGPEGPCSAHVVFKKTDDPAFFTLLANNGLATFTIRKATSEHTTRPFSGMANVRLTRVRCWAGGLDTTKEHFFRLVHTGRETFVTADGEDVIVDHDPVVVGYDYKWDQEFDPAADDFVFKGSSEHAMALTDKFALIGPFTTWNILVDNKDDRAKIQSLRIEFEGTHQAFKAKAH